MKKIIAISVVLLSGCTTIHFDRNIEPATNPTVVKEWHHNMVLSLIEVSAPINLEERCKEQQWTSVKTELSFLNILAGGAVNTIAPIWYPKSVEISCN